MISGETPSGLNDKLLDFFEDIHASGLPILSDANKLGCGSEGCVFKGANGHVYKATLGLREAQVSQALITLRENGEEHPAFVKNFKVHTFFSKRIAATWGEKAAIENGGLFAIEREPLMFDHPRSDAILDFLSTVEAHSMRGPEAMVRSKLSAAAMVDAAADAVRGEYTDLLAPDSVMRDATLLLDGLKWLYARGWYVGDLWALGLGLGYGTKPENVGFRGQVPVISDLGIAKRVTK